MEKVADDQGLVDVELELAVHAANGGGDVVTHNLGADHGESLALGRVDLAGHDGAAGLVLGEVELTKTAAGTTAEVADVLGDLGEGGGEGVEGAVGLDDGVVGGEGLELVGGGLELGAGHLGDLLGDALSEALEGVDAGTDGGTTLGELAQVGQGGLDSLDALAELGDVSGELLAEGQGSSILQVGAANLDNLLGVELVNLLLERIAEALEGGDKLLLDLEDGGDVHDGGEGVVGGGGTVDVVVGVDGLLAALDTAEDLDSAVGDDLVGVHVGLGAGAGLPDDEGEVVEELALGDLSSSLLDGLANLLVKAVAHVDGGGSALENTKGLDDRGRHAILGLVDLEVLEGTLSLSAPVLVRGDLDLAKGIALGTGFGHSGSSGVNASLEGERAGEVC